MKSQFAALVCAGALSGCGSVYQSRAQEFIATQPESAWGSKPFATHRDGERQYILSILKDPGSAQIQFDELKRVTISQSLTNPTVVPVWASRVSVNAKNSFGGYVGTKDWWFYYRDGSLSAIDDPVHGRSYTTPKS